MDSSEHHVDISDPPHHSSPPSSESTAYLGSRVSVVNVRLSSVTRLLLRTPPDTLVVAIPELGQCTGLAAKRVLRFFPGRLSFILLPGDVLKLCPKSELVSGFLFKFSSQSILSESKLHGVDDPSLISLADTLPGHESLLLSCAKQMINPGTSSLVIDPLEASVFSLLASLVAPEPKSVSTNLLNASTHSRYVQSALTYMEEQLANPITLHDLCNGCCISARTLQVSFQTVMNRPPLQVLHELRLTRLRELLLQGTKVSLACKTVGLSPSGRLSASYCNLFGELPRETRSKI